MDIKDLLKDIKDYVGWDVTIYGWMKNHRPQKDFGFINYGLQFVFV